MERKQFTFYESFYKAMSYLKEKNERAEFYDAIIPYALYGIEPDMNALPDNVAMAFEFAKPTLDASRRKAESGQAGGKREASGKQIASKSEANAKQTTSKNEANDKQTASEKEGEIEKENEIENECYSPQPPVADAEFARVMSYYLDKINSSPSSGCITDLRAYTQDLGADVVLHAISRAQDEKKTSWSYIRGILQNYTRAGYRTKDAVLQAEAAFEAEKAAKAAVKSGAPAPRQGTTQQDMDRMQRMLQRMRGEDSG